MAGITEPKIQPIVEVADLPWYWYVMQWVGVGLLAASIVLLIEQRMAVIRTNKELQKSIDDGVSARSDIHDIQRRIDRNMEAIESLRGRADGQ